MKTPYEQLRDHRNKTTPPVLEAGCYFRWNNDLWIINCIKCDGGIYAFSCTGDAHYWGAERMNDMEWEYKYKRFTKEEEEDFKILGTPLTLQEILLMFVGEEIFFCRDSSDSVFIAINKLDLLVHFDLSHPLNAPENENAIKNVLEIIKNV